MPKAPRPVFLPELGLFFEELRDKHKWTQSQAADIAHRRGLPLTRQVLLRLESGRTKNPEPEALLALATLYEVPYAELVARFMEARYHVGAPSAWADSARDQQVSFVAGQRDRYEQLLDKMSTIADEYARLREIDTAE